MGSGLDGRRWSTGFAERSQSTELEKPTLNIEIGGRGGGAHTNLKLSLVWGCINNY